MSNMIGPRADAQKRGAQLVDVFVANLGQHGDVTVERELRREIDAKGGGPSARSRCS
jgi:hypothetical protein